MKINKVKDKNVYQAVYVTVDNVQEFAEMQYGDCKVIILSDIAYVHSKNLRVVPAIYLNEWYINSFLSKEWHCTINFDVEYEIIE